MAGTDFPFSVTSKYLDQGGAELLVTVRGPTAEQFQARLAEASTIFPRAGFTANGHHPATAGQATADPQAPTNIAQARRQTEVEQVQAAHAKAREQREATGHVCPEHGVAKASRYNGGSYCPTKLESGEYCKWIWPPAKAARG